MNNKVVVIVPIKTVSKRVKNKNFRIVNKKPLYQFLLNKLKFCNFDEIYVDTDSTKIKKFCKSKNIKVINRLKYLAQDNANGNDLLNYHFKKIKAQYYFQLFITAPLLSVKTINNCIKLLKTKKNIDSILTVKKIYSWFWFKKKPVNYNHKVLPRSQDAVPIIQESTGLYGIKSKTLKKQKCRIGKKPFFYEVQDIEAIDLDNERDFKFLDFYVKKYLSSSNN